MEDASADWRTELDRPDLGPEITTWRAREGGPSIGAIMLHVIAAEVFWVERAVFGGEISDEVKKELLWDELDVDSDTWPDAPAQPLSWFFELHAKYRKQSLEAIKGWPPAETVYPFHNREVSLRWILGHLIQHEAYHGGQVMMLYGQWKASGALRQGS